MTDTTTKKTYRDMTDAEIKTAARAIIRDSCSKEEAERRLGEEIGYPYGIALTNLPWPHSPPNSKIGDGMFMAMLHGHDDTISIS